MRPDLAERNRSRATHGATRNKQTSGAYRSWHSMLQRVKGTTHARDRARYLERGIGVCERWLTFQNFAADMGERPNGMSIERINNDLGYEPGNCRWATVKEQTNNRSSNTVLEFEGVRLTVAQWADRIGIERHTLGWRMRAGWSTAEILTTTPSKANRWRKK